jgi:hypothetical protein
MVSRADESLAATKAALTKKHRAAGGKKAAITKKRREAARRVSYTGLLTKQ